MFSTYNDYAIVVTNAGTTEPPCLVWRTPTSRAGVIDTGIYLYKGRGMDCLLPGVTPFSQNDTWPNWINGVPTPRGFTLQSLSESLRLTLQTKYFDMASKNINDIFDSINNHDVSHNNVFQPSSWPSWEITDWYYQSGTVVYLTSLSCPGGTTGSNLVVDAASFVAVVHNNSYQPVTCKVVLIADTNPLLTDRLEGKSVTIKEYSYTGVGIGLDTPGFDLFVAEHPEGFWLTINGEEAYKCRVTPIGMPFNVFDPRVPTTPTPVIPPINPQQPQIPKTRILSCDPLRSQAVSSISVVKGVNATAFQPIGVGCEIGLPAFCPLFTDSSVDYRFWVRHPSMTNIGDGNKIRLYLWPGFTDNDSPVQYLEKKSCNMTNDGQTCFRISGSYLKKIGTRAGYSADVGKIVWPLNSVAQWITSSGKLTSAFQTWIIVDYPGIATSELLSCFEAI